MVEYLNVEIPQLSIWQTPNYSSITKKFINLIPESNLINYLYQKFLDYSVRHYVMNEQLREIYLTHLQLTKSRIEDEIYMLDYTHYRQLFQTEQVCKSLSTIGAELFYSIYYMKNLNTKNQTPERIEVSKAIEFVIDEPQLKDHFSPFSSYIELMRKIRNYYHINSVRFTYDILLTEMKPMGFVMNENGFIEQYSLTKFIEDYNSFFLTCKTVLIAHSPKVATILLENWKK